MKKPETLIKEREGQNPPATNATRIYTYIRPLKNGEATVEFWGARNDTRKKRRPLVCKKFFAFRTDRDLYRVRDVLRYSSWSALCHDHLCYSFPEGGGTDYYRQAYHRCGGNLHEARGKWLTDRASDTYDAFLPVGIMLNGWENTKYRWCGYDSRCGMFFKDYLALWGKYPKAEILSKTGCYQLLTEWFLEKVEDKAFAKYVCRNGDAIRRHSVMGKTIYDAYRQGIDLTEKMRRMEAEQEAAARERVRRAEERERALLIENDTRIRALYDRLVDICTTYGAYEVIVPKSSAEMLEEGRHMHNCIGHIYASKQGREDICLFLHKDGKPCVDIRIDAKTYKVMECREVCNKNADENAWNTARQIAEQVRARLAA